MSVFKDGKVVWETAEGKLLDEPVQGYRNPKERS